MGITSRIQQQFKNLALEIQAHFARIPEKIDYTIPFVCQFSTPENAEPSLRKTLKTIDDPEWHKAGASSPERYAQWAFTMCGMACTAMILAYFRDRVVAPAELAEDALKNEVYTETPKEISSMKYAEFARWVRRYDLCAEVYSRLSIRGIRYALAKGNLVIVSVSPNIRGYDTAPPGQKGGHLVVITGYDFDRNTISLNSPSGFSSTNTQIKHTLSIKEFLSYFARRGIVVKQRPNTDSQRH